MEYRKILVPVAGSRAGEEAIKLACRLAKRDKSEVHAVHVIAVKRTLPLEAEVGTAIQGAEDILDHVEEVAEGVDCEVKTHVLQAREVGPAIVDEAAEQGADLIVMGVHYKTAFGQFSLGNVIPYILKNAPCRVILFHQAPNEQQEGKE